MTLKTVEMQLTKVVQVKVTSSHQVMMMKLVMMMPTKIHLIHHQCSSKEEVREVTFLLLNIHHINMC